FLGCKIRFILLISQIVFLNCSNQGDFICDFVGLKLKYVPPFYQNTPALAENPADLKIKPTGIIFKSR
ncbi:MAG: hypothetical protein PUK02_13920, partial [Parabacteroides sp.]|nr:hypothetical protein [Parabacteroides sp.]